MSKIITVRKTMKVEVYVKDNLNSQASVLVDAQTDIKIAIKKGILNNVMPFAIKEEIERIIDKALSRIRSPTLKRDAKVSLMKFSDKLYSEAKSRLMGISPVIFPYVITLVRGITSEKDEKKFYIPHNSTERKAISELVDRGILSYNSLEKGVPLQEFSKNYIERVQSALELIAEESAKDPNDERGFNTIRNLAEMQVRYENHQQSIADFKLSGTRLVVCSVHGDCSARCAPFQGRVYSLDGTRGVTADGKEFVPLEEATDIYYTTKSGRTYKNGLLGFNCRHKLYPYKKGMVIPSVSKEEQKREYQITLTQRKLEREVIKAREKALVYKDIDINSYRKWKNIARARDFEYKEYSKVHNRAFYPDRTKIL